MMCIINVCNYDHDCVHGQVAYTHTPTHIEGTSEPSCWSVEGDEGLPSSVILWKIHIIFYDVGWKSRTMRNYLLIALHRFFLMMSWLAEFQEDFCWNCNKGSRNTSQTSVCLTTWNILKSTTKNNLIFQLKTYPFAALIRLFECYMTEVQRIDLQMATLGLNRCELHQFYPCFPSIWCLRWRGFKP